MLSCVATDAFFDVCYKICQRKNILLQQISELHPLRGLLGTDVRGRGSSDLDTPPGLLPREKRCFSSHIKLSPKSSVGKTTVPRNRLLLDKEFTRWHCPPQEGHGFFLRQK